MRRAAGLFLVGLLAAGAASAQGRGAARSAVPERRGGPGDEAYKMVDAYLLSNLQESLGLNDQQYLKLLPLVKAQHTERRELVQRRARSLMELRRTLNSGRATEASITALLDEVKRTESEGPATLARNQQAIDALLTPVQQAKYRVLEAEVERKVRDLLRSAVRGRARDRFQRGGRAPDPDEP